MAVPDYEKLRRDVIASYATLVLDGDPDICEAQKLFSAAYAEIAVSIAKLNELHDSGGKMPMPDMIVHAIVTASVFGIVNLLPSVNKDLHVALRTYAVQVLETGIDPDTDHVAGPEVALTSKADA